MWKLFMMMSGCQVISPTKIEKAQEVIKKAKELCTLVVGSSSSISVPPPSHSRESSNLPQNKGSIFSLAQSKNSQGVSLHHSRGIITGTAAIAIGRKG